MSHISIRDPILTDHFCECTSPGQKLLYISVLLLMRLRSDRDFFRQKQGTRREGSKHEADYQST
jgi:hypothetical protein